MELDPKDDSVALHDWWSYHHRDQGAFKLWLTGSHGAQVWKYLALEDRLRAGAVVLNIGVGLGHCTRELAQRRCVVHVLDISTEALAKVADCVAGSWVPTALPALPERHFDLAISNLVTQHMFDADLREQLVHVIRSLKPAGILAMQFAFALDPDRNDATAPSLDVAKTGGVCRTLGRVDELVRSSGGVVLWASRIGVFPCYGSGWYAVHIGRPDGPVPPDPSAARPGLVTRIRARVGRAVRSLRG